MVETFHGHSEEKHDAFQAWRQAHPNGFHLTDKGGGIFSAHWTQDKRENDFGRGCIHQGGSRNPYMDDKRSCFTAAKKVCSDSLQELCDWAASEGVTIKYCAHCATKRFPFPNVVVRTAQPNGSDALLPTGNSQPGTISTTVTQYMRDDAVRTWVLKKAAGSCECCQAPAPFTGTDGQPFLEVHHVRQLAEGGTDTISNTVALCPNCHRQLHHGANAPLLISQLFDQVRRLIRE